MCHICFFISFLIVCYPDKYKTQKVCDEAVDDNSVVAFPNSFVSNKIT